jgi:rod shape-determining protein MreD
MGPTARLVRRVALVIVSAAVVQVAVVSAFPVAGVRPPVLVLVAIGAGLALGPGVGAGAGFAAGLTFDLLLSTPLGLCAGVFAVTGQLVARFRPSGRSVPRRTAGSVPWWHVALIGAGATVAAYLAVLVAGLLLAQRPLPTDGLVLALLVMAGAHGLCTPVAVRILAWAGAGDRAPAAVVARGR